MKKKDNKCEGFMQGVMILMFSQFIIKIIGLIYKLYLTNKTGFGDKGNAIYSAGFQIYALLLTISSIGVPNAISKLVSSKVAIGDNKGAYRIFKIAIAIFGTIGFIGSLILFMYAKQISYNYLQIPETEIILTTFSPSIFLVSISSVLRGYFNGREKISTTAKSQSLEQLLKAITTIIIVEIIGIMSKNNTKLMAAGAAIATTFSTAVSFLYLYVIFIKRKKDMWKEVLSSTNYRKDKITTIIKNILIVSIPISITAMLSATTKTIDALTVIRITRNIIGEKQATLQYGILSGKIDTLITLPFSFNIAFSTALIPAISAALAKKEVYLAEKRIHFSILITILIGLPCSLGIGIFAEPILKLLFPNASSGTTMLQISSMSIIFVVLTQTISGALQGLGNVKAPVIALGVGTIVKLILNLILVPIEYLGVYGAIISSIISHFVTFIICFIELKKKLNISFKISRFIIKPLIATINMCLISWLILYKCNFNLIISLGIGMLIYILSILFLKTLLKEEIFMIPYGQKLYTRIEKHKKINRRNRLISTTLKNRIGKSIRNKRFQKQKKKDFI